MRAGGREGEEAETEGRRHGPEREVRVDTMERKRNGLKQREIMQMRGGVSEKESKRVRGEES